MRKKYYIKKAVVLTVWFLSMLFLISSAIRGDVDLRYMLVSDDYPHYIPGAPEAVSFPININTANLRELKQIDGIGDTKAREIISYREKNGEFSSVDELINVKGIGESTLEKIREFITV